MLAIARLVGLVLVAIRRVGLSRPSVASCVGLALVSSVFVSGCGGGGGGQAAADAAAGLLGIASKDVGDAQQIARGLGGQIDAGASLAGSTDIPRAQSLLDDAMAKVSQVRQQSTASADAQQADTVAADASGVQSTVRAEQAATEEAAALARNQSSFQTRVTKYIYKTATSKLCQEIATAISGQQASPQYWYNQVYATVQADLGQAYPPQLVQEIAGRVATVVQDDVNRINAFINANPANPADDLRAALSYYNCLPQ